MRRPLAMAHALAALVPAALLALVAPVAAQRGAPPTRTVAPEATPALARVRWTDRPLATLPPAVRPSQRGTGLPAIVLTGYWPPSNEAIRRFSDDPGQNPGGWVGADWEGRGYDVFAYFPEFVPPNCSNCGRGSGDLEVDYQDTTADFRPLVGQHAPVAVVTFSRGFHTNDWELEMNQYNRDSWFPDYAAPFEPTPNPPDASVPAGHLRPTALPVNEIVTAVNANVPGVNAFLCFAGDGGGFLSEFAAYQGVWYRADHRSPTFPTWCIAAGHVHVGGQLSWQTASDAVDETLRALIAHLDATVANTLCQPEQAPGGPGTATLAVCGEPLASGASADLLLDGAPPSTFSAIVAGTDASTPFAWKGGLVVPIPAMVVQVLPVDATGRGLLEGLPGGGGPATIYTQVVYRDLAQAKGWGFTNTLALDLLP